MPDPADYYREIYLRGLGGETPAIPVAVAELEQRAREAMDPKAANYVWAGAGSEDTIDANAEAFRRRRIVPRMLRDVAARDLSTTLLGTAMPAPLLLAPIGVQKVVHDEGELATARAAAAVGVPMIASTAAHFSLEEIAEAGGDAPRWFQLYWPNDPALARSMVERAERAGYGAIVLTVDTFIPGWKPRDLQQAWLPFLNGMGVANYFQDPVFRAALEKPPEEDVGAATGHFLGIQANPSLNWDDLAQLREMTSLPIVIKGIQHPDDAREAVRRGIDGIVVSNHGGRQVDGAIASLDALPAIADAAGDDLTILFDSGVRGGADALKALALGADAVCLGRPYIWGLALGGQAAVETVLKMVLAELDLTMALCGYTRPDELGPEALSEPGQGAGGPGRV
jgi:L-lactate dehydrogenase (cytochrome)